ncbi:MAG: DUF2271 domain-containing protein [Chitinivibrionales bacterium]|nr:DUF2271 domain-containing protein [Chitinivibrionales bacterium]
MSFQSPVYELDNLGVSVKCCSTCTKRDTLLCNIFIESDSTDGLYASAHSGDTSWFTVPPWYGYSVYIETYGNSGDSISSETLWVDFPESGKTVLDVVVPIMSDTLEISYTTNLEAHSKTVAVWLEDLDSNYIKTLFVGQWLTSGGALNYFRINERWQDKYNDDADAVAGATPCGV